MTQDELKALEAGIAYQVGPGITTSLSLLYADWEGANGNDADGTVGVVGLKYRF